MYKIKNIYVLFIAQSYYLKVEAEEKLEKDLQNAMLNYS